MTPSPNTQSPNTQLEIMKVRNGCWRVLLNGKKYSEHSMESGAISMAENIQKRLEVK